MSELKPCPFDAHDEINVVAGTGGWLCKCNKCFSRTTYYPTRDEAITAWNTRTTDDRVSKLVEAAQAALDGGVFKHPSIKEKLQQALEAL